MSKLLDQQIVFTLNISRLIRYAYDNGYGLTCGDFYRDGRCSYGHPKSLHRQRLAADVNLFLRTPDNKWEYLKLTEAHLPLGEYWESLDQRCSWGGRFENPDGNHYSMKWEGVR